MSDIVGTELQSLPTPQEEGMHIVAVLLKGVDGHRCYMAGFIMPRIYGPGFEGMTEEEKQEVWDTAKESAIQYCRREGNKVKPEAVTQFFVINPETMTWAK